MAKTRVLTVKQAADEVGVHPETVRRWIRGGELAAHRARFGRGTPLLIYESDLTAFVQTAYVE